MAYTRAVAMVMGTLLVLSLREVVAAGVGQSSVFSSSSSSGAAQSQVMGADGTVTGQCAYLDPQGRSVRISYKQYPGGQLEVRADPPMNNAAAALQACRRAADAAAKIATTTFQKTQQEIFARQQELQNQIIRQNQAFQQNLGGFFPLPQYFPFGPTLP